jgi:hypothetical protein
VVPFKREKGIAAAVIGIASAAVLSPEAHARQRVSEPPQPEISAAHEGCYEGSFCYAHARTNQLIADGAAARFNYVSGYSAPDQGHQEPGHTNQTLWVGVNNDPGQWCEVGWTKGGFGFETYPYWGRFSNGTYEAYPLYFGLGPPGTSHHWQIVRQYNGLYNVYIDNQDVADCFVDPFTLEIDVGLEYTSPSAAAPTVEPQDLQYRDINLVWHSWGEQGNVEDPQEVGPRSNFEWITEPTHGKDWIN